MLSATRLRLGAAASRAAATAGRATAPAARNFYAQGASASRSLLAGVRAPGAGVRGFATTRTAAALATQSRLATTSTFNKHEELAREILRKASAGSSGQGGVALQQSEQQLLNQGSYAAGAIAQKGLVFEFSFFWVLGAYQHVFIGLLRNSFYTFRPIIILFVFGQLLKMAFFAMGAPMLVSFYSIWMFEVFYGLLQCFLSFIFVSQYYNNMCFASRTRPLMRRMQAQFARKVQALKGRMQL